LDYNEFINGSTCCHGEFSKYEIDQIFKMADTDNNGSIDYSEFIAATVNRGNMLQEEKLKAAFDIYDIDGNGTIELDELKEVLGVGEKICDHVW
jgi:Ca2+-binding EF-hand superfamily protein